MRRAGFLGLIAALLLAGCGSVNSEVPTGGASGQPTAALLAGEASGCPAGAGALSGPLAFVSQNKLFTAAADGSDVRQLTNARGYDGGPFISPDGKWVIFRSDRNKESYLQIHAISIDGKNDVALTDNEGVNWAPYWHPTKPWIIWTGADHSNPKARPNYDLWLMKYVAGDGKLAAATKPVRITDDVNADVLPVFSPDGTRLMWTSNRTDDRESQLFIAEFDLNAAEKALDAARTDE